MNNEKELRNVLAVIDEYSKSLDPSSLDTLRSPIIEMLEMPVGDPWIDEIVIHPYIVIQYAFLLLQSSGRNFFNDEAALHDQMKRFLSIQNHEADLVRIRRFESRNGYYYGFPFKTPDGFYTFWSDEPFLITRMTKEWQDELRFGTELGSLSRLEVKMIASMMFSNCTWHGPTCYFQFSEEVHDLPASLILGKDAEFSDISAQKANIAFRIIKRLELYERLGFRSQQIELSPFEFRSSNFDPSRAQKFFQRFDLNDNLELRTAFLLIKSASLWSHGRNIFGEEATANMFFSLEGSLRLLHKRTKPGKNFELLPTLSHIETTFSHRPGYRAMLEDAYQKRIEIVHPEPNNRVEWFPELYADDFYENYGMANDLFYYAITGEILSEG